MINQIYLFLVVVLLFSCGSKNPDRQAPVTTYDPVSIEFKLPENEKEPKVNILFVVDNSGSMQTYQEKMAKNIELFANRFFENPRIDYKIGVVPVYDSKYLNDKTVYRSGLRKMNPLGELVALKGLSDSDTGHKLFITRETLNPKDVLKQTVLLGTQWGPEAEESFSPVLAVMDETINQTKNESFYDKDAYLAIIFLTDADDVTLGLSGEDFYNRLVQLKDGNRSKILIAAALPDLKNNSSSCSKDGAGPIQSLPALMRASGGIVANLCASDTDVAPGQPNQFGYKLAEFGKSLIQRIATQKIALGFTPDINSLKVFYGEKEIPRGSNGYSFDPETNEVILSANLNLAHNPNSIIKVKATPADLSNYKNGNLNYGN